MGYIKAFTYFCAVTRFFHPKASLRGEGRSIRKQIRKLVCCELYRWTTHLSHKIRRTSLQSLNLSVPTIVKFFELIRPTHFKKEDIDKAYCLTIHEHDDLKGFDLIDVNKVSPTPFTISFWGTKN